MAGQSDLLQSQKRPTTESKERKRGWPLWLVKRDLRKSQKRPTTESKERKRGWPLVKRDLLQRRNLFVFNDTIEGPRAPAMHITR